MMSKEMFKNSVKKVCANKVIIACMLLSFIYVLSGYLKYLEIFVSVIALLFMAFLSIQNSFCIFMFLHCFTLSNIVYDSFFLVTLVGYVIILCVKYIIGLKQGKYVFYKKLALILAGFVLVSFFISLFFDLYGSGFLYFSYFPFIYLIFVMKNEIDITQGMNYMFGGLLASIGLSLTCLLLPNFKYYSIVDNRFSAFINNTNYLYIRCLFVLCYYMFRYLSKQLTNAKFITIYLILAFATFSTLSKTGIAMLILMSFIFVILFLRQDFKKNIKIVGIFFVLALLLCIIGYKFIIAIFNRFAESFESNNFWNSLLTGRDEIWLAYIKEIFNNPINALFGHGIVATEVYVPEQLETRASHNLYIFLLYRFGIVGCIALGYIIYRAIKNAKIVKPKLIAYLPLIFILIESLFDNTFKCYHFTYFVFAILILMIKPKNNRVIDVDKKVNDN